MRKRSARWLRIRIVGLLSADTRLARYFAATRPKPPQGEPPVPERFQRRA